MLSGACKIVHCGADMNECRAVLRTVVTYEFTGAVRRMRLGPQTTSPTFLFQSFHILDTFHSMCNIRT